MISSRAGYVLVGGKSSRMGRDKALLPFRGSTLALNIAEAVQAAAGTVALVGSEVPDLYPGEGPLGGILTALQHSAAEWNLIVACDMPELSAEFLRQLLDAACQRGGDVLLPTGPSGRPEPLCAVYHRRCRPALQQAFDRGIRKVTTALEQLPCILWPVSEVAYFQNVNTQEEWAPYGR